MSRKLLLLLFFVAFGLSSSCSKSGKKVLVIPNGKVGLIGYGSLTSSKQMEKQLEKAYLGPVHVIHLDGYRRNWNMVFPNDSLHPPVKYLIQCERGKVFPKYIVNPNLEPYDGGRMNACLFLVDQEDLITLDRTEKGYSRVDVTSSVAEFDVQKGKVYAYQALPEYTKTPIHNEPDINVIPDVYMEFLYSAFEEKGPQYRLEFEQSTVGFDSTLVSNCIIKSLE